MLRSFHSIVHDSWNLLEYVTVSTKNEFLADSASDPGRLQSPF